MCMPVVLCLEIWFFELELEFNVDARNSPIFSHLCAPICSFYRCFATETFLHFIFMFINRFCYFTVSNLTQKFISISRFCKLHRKTKKKKQIPSAFIRNFIRMVHRNLLIRCIVVAMHFHCFYFRLLYSLNPHYFADFFS